MPRWGSKVLAVGPGLAIGTVVIWMVGAVLPPAAGAVLFVGAVAVTTALAFGVAEGPAVAVLSPARRLRPHERTDLAPVLTLLCRAGLGPPVIDIRVRRGRAIGAAGTGRRTAVVTTGLLEAVADGDLPPEQAAAVIAHAATLVRAGLVRSDPLIGCWSLPWDLLHATAEAVARSGRQLPLTTLAWRLRAVVITGATIQSVQQGHPRLAALIAAIGAVSYAMPLWQRNWKTLLITAGDRGLSQAGFAPAMAAFLRRCPATDTTRARLRALHVAERPAPVLGLVTR